MALLKKSTPKKTEMKVVPDESDGTAAYVAAAKQDPFADKVPSQEGRLSVDVFQTVQDLVVVAPVAGVRAEDLSITLTDDVLTIQGRRSFEFIIEPADYLTQECFWGKFSRAVVLPPGIEKRGVSASLKNGILTVRIPKTEEVRTRMVEILEE